MGTIRVITGKAKGRRLKLVPGDSTRPIMDRAKEALFSILGNHVYDAQVLDLFAGTGSVGIEALSRGATRCTFLDLERKAIETIRDNLKATDLTEQADIKQANAFTFLKTRPMPYDLIYIAPPQYKDMWLETLKALDEAPGWLSEDGIIVVQIDPKEQKPVELTAFTAYDERKYGSTFLWFFEHRIDETDEGTPQ
jgi:16S rRNA (guanine(966)-N(2))-methyltransferase RsmD